MNRLIAACLLASAAAAESRPAPDAENYLNTVKYLSSPKMRGRETGSPQLEKAAHYLAKQFRDAGLQPLVGDSYLQPFPITANARLGPRSSLRYTVDGGSTTSLQAKTDFVPFSFSSSGSAKAPVVFCGYGITAPEYAYDDYAGVDVKGKWVLVLRHEPQEFDEKSAFAGKSYTAHSELFSKASNAKAHAAAGVILVNDLSTHPEDRDVLEPFGSVTGPSNSGIPFVQIRAASIAPWFEGEKDERSLLAQIDHDGKPHSRPLPVIVDARVDLTRALRTVHNVGAWLPGDTDEYVIIGAHYDHLGTGRQFSLAPSLAGTVHPGADDNASGTAGVLELARWFAAQPKRKRGVLFLCFAGEELGLLGSNYYVQHPLLPLEKAEVMINLDMIGRVREHHVYVGGAGTGTGLEKIVAAQAVPYDVHPDLSEKSGYGSSDHTSFTAHQVPVLFFFSGLHADYHKPSDTWDKIDAPASVNLLRYIAAVAERLDEASQAPRFVRVAPPENAHGIASTAGGGGSGYGPDFGSVPDFTEIPNGVRFADIRPGSPAAKAGLRPGDVLTEFDGQPIGNLYDFTYALRAKRPGQEVLVRVLREGQSIEAKVLLTARK